METVEFYATINNGKIDVPAQYLDEFRSEVKVLIFKPLRKHIATRKEKAAKGFGALAHRANPALWELEDNAWERAVIEKYGSN
jgi:hypothetical protein